MMAGPGPGSAAPAAPAAATRWLAPVLALMVYGAALGGLGLIAVGDGLAAAGRSLTTTLSLQVPATASPARLKTLLALLRQTPGIAAAHLLPRAETDRLLRPWLGPSAPFTDLPIPRLIDLRADPAKRIDFAVLRKHLASVAPGAQLDDHRVWLRRVDGVGRRIMLLLAIAIAVTLAAVGAAAAWAARGALAARRRRVELELLLGATVAASLRGFVFDALVLALWAAAIGDAATLATVAALDGAAAFLQPNAPIVGLGFADWRLWAVLGGVAAAAALIAAASAWAAVRRPLARLA